MSFLSDVPGNQKKKLNSMEMDVVVKLLQWPSQQCLPVFDLLRVFLTHHQSERLFSGVDSGMNQVLKLSSILADDSNSEGMRTLIVKTLCNLCNFTQNKNSLFRFGETVMATLGMMQIRCQSPAFRNALSALVFNYSLAYQEVATNLYDDQHINRFLALLLSLL